MTGPRILIVDDDPELCRVACWTLEAMGSCTVAHDLDTAIRMIDETRFDLVLIDVMLQGESGLDLLDVIAHRAPESAATVMSGIDDLDTARTALGRGALAYLVKPFRVNDLRIHVASACAAQHRLNASATGRSPRDRVVAQLEAMLARDAKVLCAVVEFQQLPLANRAGRAVCAELAHRLKHADLGNAGLRVVGALGEVSFVLAGVCEPGRSMADAAALVREAIDRSALVEPLDPSVHGCVTPRFVVGVSVRESDADALLTEAESSARAALEQHLPTVGFTSELCAAAGEEMELFTDLALAIDRNEIHLAYQPQYFATSGRMVGVEALARWHHPLRGEVSPAVFVPLAEHNGLIDRLGERVLRVACTDAASLGRSPDAGPRVSVNVSVAQLRDPGFVDSVLAALSDSGLPPWRLCLEVTETLVLDDSECIRRHFARLSAHGIRLSLDDFGTGFSTFESLGQFPWSEIKVDNALTAQYATRCGREILRSVVVMATRLDLDVVAEGVETVEQLEAMRALGVGTIQGFLLGRPVPIEPLRRELLAGSRPQNGVVSSLR